mgnify:CR=1 FL=1
MWPKEDYQEHMLGYIDGVRVELEQLAYTGLGQHERNAIYVKLYITLNYLWTLIESSDAEWEKHRYALEDSCDVLLRTFYSTQYADSLSYRPSLELISIFRQDHQTMMSTRQKVR